MRKLFIRTFIISCWITLIACILYWPKWNVIPHNQNTLNIFAWGDIIDPEVVADFEKQTGIKVHISYYSSNEELIVKLKATGGEGYDLIMPSDYAVSILRDDGLIKEIDRSKFTYWDVLNPSLTGHFFDPENRYSIPWEWELYGFGYDKDYFKNKPFNPSWKMLFDPNVVSYEITMVNDPIEAVEFASFYLYGIVPEFTEEQVDQIKNVLVRQRNWVTAYANFRGDYFLATRTCPLIIASSSYIWRTMRLFDFVSYAVPEEGSFITIENFSIPKATKKDALVYQFLNHIYSPESVAAHYTSYGYFPSTLHALSLLDLDPQAAKLMKTTPAEFKNYHFLQRIIPQQKVRDIWVEVKSGDF